MKVELDLPETVIASIVKRAAKANPQEGRQIIVADADRQAIEAVFQTTVNDGTDLAKKIRNLATVKIGGIDHTFSYDELARLDMQAVFHGRSRDTFIREMIREIADRMLEKV